MTVCTCKGDALDYCTAPNPWVRRWMHKIPKIGPVADIACGTGRHTALLALNGYEVLSYDIDTSLVGHLADEPLVTIKQYDLESQPWPIAPDSLAGIVVTNYLHRPHFPKYFESLKSGGVFIMETFTVENTKRFGRPRNPDHTLQLGELYRLMPVQANLIAYEEVESEGGTFVARIVWQKP